MTKKDYEIIANAIREALNNFESQPIKTGVIAVAKRIANKLYADNPHFDRERFMQACGL